MSASAQKKRVLFVDDERLILDGLRRMLRSQRGEWDMEFLGSAEEALRAMKQAPFDVIVSDMRMPGMDGAALLARVQECFPATVRIVLSGHSELESALRAAAVAHQFLSKPCDAEALRSVVRRACDLQTLLDDASLHSALGTIKSIPAAPRIYNQLIAIMADPDSGVAQVAEIVQQDAALTAKVLQLVNSSFFGISQSVVDIRQATSFLGMNTLRDLTLSVEVFQAFDSLPRGISLDDEQVHSLMTARVAGKLQDSKEDREASFLAAMLHDVGKLILASSVQEAYPCRAQAGRPGVPDYLAETESYGVCHAEVGAYVLGLWGMPYEVTEAVAHHHHPYRVDQDRFGVLGSVHVADALVRELVDSDADSLLNVRYLRDLGVENRLDEWRQVAAEEVRLVLQEAH